MIRVARMLHVSRRFQQRICDRAAHLVSKAIRRGHLPRLDGRVTCADCGKSACYYDHRNYLEPLKVEPVCSSCNQLRGPGFPKLRMTDFEEVRRECMEALKG